MTQRVDKEFGDLLSDSWDEYKKNFKIYFNVFLLLVVIPSLVLFVYQAPHTYNLLTQNIESFQDILDIFGTKYMIIMNVLWIITLALAMFMSISLIYNSIYKKNKMSVEQTLKGGKKYFWRYIFFSLVYLIFIIGLSLLLIIPGLIFIVYWLFAPYILIKENKGIIASLKSSYCLVKGRWWKTFWTLLLFALVLILILIIFSVVSAILNVLIMIPFVFSAVSKNGFEILLTKGFFTNLPFSAFLLTNLVSKIFELGQTLIIAPLSILFFKNLYLEYLRKR